MVRSPGMSPAAENFNRVLSPALSTLVLAGTAAAQPREPLDLVPADSLLCWSGHPVPETTPPASQPSVLQTLLELGTRIAGRPLESGAQLTVRGLEFLSLSLHHPHAIALIDAAAIPIESDPRGRRVDRLCCAVVVRTDGRNEPVLGIIQKAVNEQTNRGTATLVRRQAGQWWYQELRDSRLPEWTAIAWGRLGDYFVLTLGPDVWPRIAAVADGKAESLAQDPWYAAARARQKHSPQVEILVAAEAIKQRLDQLVSNRASAFFRAWQAEKLKQAYWALGFEGRALYCRADFRIGNQTQRRFYADPGFGNARLNAMIPPATRYAIFRIPVDRFLPRFCGGLVATRDPGVRANIERFWAEFQNDQGLDAQRDLLQHLGDRVIMHNDPPHPLGIPLALTILIEIDRDSARVRHSIDTICSALRDSIEQAATEDAKPPTFTLHRDPDGIWHLRFGPLAGPAWTVTEHFLIASWSPHALREYLKKTLADDSPAPEGPRQTRDTE